MAYPIDPAQGILRTPSKFPHDAFGVDTGGRVRPHSGTDSTPRVANCPARSVLGGRVIRIGWTIYAGNYVVVAAPDGWLWLDIHLARPSVVADEVIRPGDTIGIVGNTGGGGSGPLAGKTGKLAIHLHTSRCRDLEAVDRIINGLVRARRKGETSAQWAAAHGFSDPYPHIIASVAAEKAAAEAAELAAKAAAEKAAAEARASAQRQKELSMIPILIRIAGKDYFTQPVTGKRVLVEGEVDRQRLDAAIKSWRKTLEDGGTTVELGKYNGAALTRYLDRLAAA